ncbi:MAG: nitroreductase family protein [Bacteroidaceae bacterium]|nr:nitroreductase family protein [Bacteroidaceae bacterium]
MKKFEVFVWPLALMMLVVVSGCGNSGSTFDQLVSERRSVRSYDATKKVTEDEVRTLIATAQEAPSWANVQGTSYYAVMSQDKLQALQPIMGSNAKNIADVNVVLVTTFKQGASGFFDGQASNELGDGWGAFDNGLSNAFLILKAKDMGFDTLIMGLRDADGLRRLLDIPNDEVVTSVIALGYGKAVPNRPMRKQLHEILHIK